MNWLSPAWLWALPLMMAPPLIHYLFRRRFKRIRWAAVEILQRAFKKNRQRRRLEEILLLLLRIAALAVLVLALARPELTSASYTIESLRRPQIILFDVSASTQRQDGLRTVFDRLRERAVGFLDNIDRNRSVLFYPMPGGPVVEGRDSVLTTLQSLQPTYFAGDWGAAIDDMILVLKNRNIGDCDVAVFSDFQSSDFASVTQWPASWHLTSHGIDLPRPVNRWIASLRAGPGFPGAGGAWNIHCRLEGDPGTTNLTLVNAGKTLVQKDVVITDEGSLDLVLPIHFDSSGWQQLTAQIGDDTYLFDNSRHLAVRSNLRPKILVLTDAERSLRDLLVMAIDPRSEYDVETRPLPPRNLDNLDVLIWDLPTPPDAQMAASLNRALEVGMLAAFFPPADADPDAWASSLEWLPRFRSVDADDPATFVPDPSGLFHRWHAYFRPYKFTNHHALSGAGQVQWTDDSLRPVLTYGRQGNGTWVMGGVSLTDASQGDWIASPLYVGLLRSLVKRFPLPNVTSLQWIPRPDDHPEWSRPGFSLEDREPVAINAPLSESSTALTSLPESESEAAVVAQSRQPLGLTFMIVLFSLLGAETLWLIWRSR